MSHNVTSEVGCEYIRHTDTFFDITDLVATSQKEHRACFMKYIR